MPADRRIVVEWGDVKRAFIDAIENGTKLGHRQPINEKIDYWYRQPTGNGRESWDGATPAQTAKYVRQGYFAEEFAHSAEYAALSNKKHFSYNDEEGELDIDRVFDGHDAIFLDREMRESRPGIRIMVEFAFSSATEAKTISEYGAWVASLIKSLEASGFDLVVDMWINLWGLFEGDIRNRRNSHVLIRVKQENEYSNFTEWSALFSPSGYRHLGFLAKCLAGEQIGKKVTDSFGKCHRGKGWGVEYDKDNQQVTINVNQMGSSLPVDKLNEEAIEAGLIQQPLKIST